jgi:hypothetical protein
LVAVAVAHRGLEAGPLVCELDYLVGQVAAAQVMINLFKLLHLAPPVKVIMVDQMAHYPPRIQQPAAAEPVQWGEMVLVVNLVREAQDYIPLFLEQMLLMPAVAVVAQQYKAQYKALAVLAVAVLEVRQL